MFNSRSLSYRSPIGAIGDHQPVHFRVTMPRDLRVSAVRLLVLHDQNQILSTLDLFWCGMNGENFEWWECHFIPQEEGLYFYHFQVNTWRGWQDLYRGTDGEDSAFHGPIGRLWQLTVFEHTYRTPDWLSGGVMYQIFPDRFFASGKEKLNVPNDRMLHKKWDEEPIWQSSEKGIVKNNDYFGGDLLGITQKLDYLKGLGVTCIYLNPIFEAHSNHRYNTANYEKIDPLLGNEEDFRTLCREAKKLGIHIIIDGVFNHTGSDSIYFNREGRYPEPGAYQSKNSPYYSWYRFHNWPNDYECWWNFNTLPDVNEENPDYRNYITGKDGIIRKWIRAGASGWRLDVADELPDDFLEDIRKAAREENPDAVILGEVWEDATTKYDYGKRRQYLLGNQLDSVMNYPFRNAILGFLSGQDAAQIMESITEILENYPPQTIRILMNHIGTHDTERALSALGGEPLNGRNRKWQSKQKLSEEQRTHGVERLKAASLIQYTLPGVPCLYYGDEAGMEGYRDPFNRRVYPWGNEDADLLEWYRGLGSLRKEFSCLKEGDFQPIHASGHLLIYTRSNLRDQLLIAVNAADSKEPFYLPNDWRTAQVEFGPEPDRNGSVTLEAQGMLLLSRRKIAGPNPSLETLPAPSFNETIESIKDQILESEEKPVIKEQLMDFLQKIDSQKSDSEKST